MSEHSTKLHEDTAATDAPIATPSPIPTYTPTDYATPPVITEAPQSNDNGFQPTGRLSKLKTAFLYVLIGALVASAITAVMALLLGNTFSAAIGRSLLTIFILFAHSLMVLALLWADTKDQVGRKLLPTTFIALTFANMISTMLSTWEIITAETAWRLFGFYFLVLGAAFICAGILKLRIAHTATQSTIYTAVGLIAIMVVALGPWVLNLFQPLDQMYYRIVAALSILAATTYMIAIIMRGIALGHHAELKASAPKSESVPGGLLAIYITFGSITAMVWFIGMIGLISSGVQSNSPQTSPHYYQTENNRYY